MGLCSGRTRTDVGLCRVRSVDVIREVNDQLDAVTLDDLRELALIASAAHGLAGNRVDCIVAVVVDTVTRLGRTRIDIRLVVHAVVAVVQACVLRDLRLRARSALGHLHGLVAIQITVVIAAFVFLRVAIVVGAITDLRGTEVVGLDRVVAVIAIKLLSIYRKFTAGALRGFRDLHSLVTVAVGVVVAALIRHAVAVIVQPVAHFGARGFRGRIADDGKSVRRARGGFTSHQAFAFAA